MSTSRGGWQSHGPQIPGGSTNETPSDSGPYAPSPPCPMPGGCDKATDSLLTYVSVQPFKGTWWNLGSKPGQYNTPTENAKQRALVGLYYSESARLAQIDHAIVYAQTVAGSVWYMLTDAVPENMPMTTDAGTQTFILQYWKPQFAMMPGYEYAGYTSSPTTGGLAIYVVNRRSVKWSPNGDNRIKSKYGCQIDSMSPFYTIPNWSSCTPLPGSTQLTDLDGTLLFADAANQYPLYDKCDCVSPSNIQSFIDFYPKARGALSIWVNAYGQNDIMQLQTSGNIKDTVIYTQQLYDPTTGVSQLYSDRTAFATFFQVIPKNTTPLPLHPADTGPFNPINPAIPPGPLMADYMPNPDNNPFVPYSIVPIPTTWDDIWAWLIGFGLTPEYLEGFGLGMAATGAYCFFNPGKLWLLPTAAALGIIPRVGYTMYEKYLLNRQSDNPFGLPVIWMQYWQYLVADYQTVIWDVKQFFIEFEAIIPYLWINGIGLGGTLALSVGGNKLGLPDFISSQVFGYGMLATLLANLGYSIISGDLFTFIGEYA